MPTWTRTITPREEYEQVEPYIRTLYPDEVANPVALAVNGDYKVIELTVDGISESALSDLMDDLSARFPKAFNGVR
jgi:hypothetical protein